jgi:hypothetical protein
VSRSSPIAAASVSSPMGRRRTLVDDREQQRAVHLVEARLVDLQERERVARLARDAAAGAHLREVAYAAEEPVRDPRRAARAARDLRPAGGIERHVQMRRARENALELARGVEVEAERRAEAIAERRRQEAWRRRADEAEGLQRQLQRPRRRAPPHDEVEPKSSIAG